MTTASRLTTRAATIVLVTAGAALVASILFLGWNVLSQSRSLERNVGVTEDIINANVRTLGQAQRELLRLAQLLESGTDDVDALELQRSFVAQRMTEATLSYQLQTLGTEELLGRSRDLVATWEAEIQPRVRDILAAPSDASAADRAEVVARLQELELGFNDLVAAGEINRKEQAGQANAAAVDLLDNTRLLLAWLAGTLVGLLVFLGAALGAWYRIDRQREADRRRLVAMNSELRLLSQVASSTHNAVVITDASGDTLWVNRAFEELTGYDADDLVGRPPGELVQGPETDPGTVAAMSRAIAAGEGFHVEVVNYSRSGEPYWVDIEVQPVRDDDGTLTHFVAVESDVTERRQTEEHLRAAKEAAESARRSAEGSARDKASFLATMSHEIRTPLNGVLGLTGMLLETDLDATQRGYAETARSSGSLLLALINNILDFSALESGRVELDEQAFELSPMLEATTSLLVEQASRAGIELRCLVDEDVPAWVYGDVTRLQQALVNLTANAVKFTERGRVELRVSRLDADELRFQVADTGVGIPPDRLDRLFRPFSQVDASTTRRYGGTGLGLAISKAAVELLGGTIRVRSEPGAGTVFTIDVPLVETLPLRQRADVSVPPVASRSLRVLLAEDDPVNQVVALHLLERLGHRVEVAGNGREAVDAVVGGAFDVVLMDVNMPVMDGVAATAELTARLGDDRPAVVAMTANALAGDREGLLAAGMDGYVSKPVRPEDLAAALAEVAATLPVDPATEATPEAPPVDVAAFLRRYGPERRDLLDEMVAMLVDSGPARVAALRDAVGVADTEAVRQAAHALVGAAAYASAESLQRVAKQLERSAEAGSLEDAAARVDLIAAELGRVDEWRARERLLA